MTVSEIIEQVKSRTGQKDQTKVLRELRSAYRWALRRVYNSEGGPDIIVVAAEEKTISGTTRDYDLAGALTYTMLGVKQLWLKLSADSIFTPMVERDTNDYDFIRNDSALTASPVLATGHPVYYDVLNFQKVRFAPALPDGCKIRVDYYRFGTTLDPSVTDAMTAGADLTTVFHDAVLNKCTALVFDLLDDARSASFEARAESDLRDALHVGNRRVQRPASIQGFRVRRRRFL